MTQSPHPAGRPRRLRAVLALLVLGLVVVSARLVWIQVVSAPAFAQAATTQRLRDVELTPRRGALLDREGEPLAVTKEARSVYASPRLVSDPQGTAVALSGVLGGDSEDYLALLGRPGDFVYIERKVSLEKAQVISGLALPGIGLLDDYERVYPGGTLAAQILGFVGVDDGGLAGLEFYHDPTLAGVSGRLVAERDNAGRILPGTIRVAEDPVDGEDVRLTIDRDIQYEAERALVEAVERWEAKAGSVVVMDPDTGGILAMASVPTFDPNRFGEADPEAVRNRPVTDVYEPGSTMKCMTAAAVLEEGIFEPGSVFDLAPTIEVADRVIHESHERERVRWTLEEIVAYSSNVGAVELGRALGEEDLHSSFTRFGLDEATGVDFPGETKGYLPPLEDWSGSSIGNIPFGQGMSVTVLQLARTLGAVANGGRLVTPHFASDGEHDEGEGVADTGAGGAADAGEEDPAERRAMSEETAAQMRDILASVVSTGTGGEAAIEGYTVAGKTGTSQKARTDGRGYATGEYVASFAGFLPVEDPELLIVVTVDEPRGSIYGGTVAAPAFRRIGEFAARHLAIAPVIESTDPAR